MHTTRHATRAHTISRAREDCPCTPGEERYHRELWEEIPGLYNNRMTDEEFEIFVRLDGGVRVGSLWPSEEFYTQADHVARYFNDEDLYQHSEEEYDYPRGVEDDYDEYMWSDELEDRESFDDRRDIWPSSREHASGAQELSLVHEEPTLDAQYFDANDLYDRGELYNLWGEEEREDHRGRVVEDTPSRRHKDTVDTDTSTGRVGHWPRTSTEEKSPVQRRYGREVGGSYMRTQTMLRSRAQSG